MDVPIAELLDSQGRLTLHRDVDNGPYFAVSLKSSQLRLLARGFIGYVPLTDDLVVYIRPRVPVANLGRIAQVAGVSGATLSVIRAYRTEAGWNESLTDIYATALADQVSAARSQGLLREYVRREEVTSSPRGRLMVATTARRFWSRGLRHRAAVSWFERTPDNPANQCLKYAVWSLAQQYHRQAPVRGEQRKLLSRLNSAFNDLDGVALRHDEAFLSDPLVTGARALPAPRAYYRPALDLAVSIITQRAIVLGESGGPVQMASVVLNMDALFEAYVRRSLQRSAELDGWAVRVLDGNERPGRQHLFSDSDRHDAQPDVVLRDADGTTPLLIDVKNVPVSNTGNSKRDAIEQVATYALSYGASDVLLVHPRSAGQPGGLHRLGTLGHVRVWQYRLDLAAVDLDAEVAAFAAALATAVPALRVQP